MTVSSIGGIEMVDGCYVGLPLGNQARGFGVSDVKQSRREKKEGKGGMGGGWSV